MSAVYLDATLIELLAFHDYLIINLYPQHDSSLFGCRRMFSVCSSLHKYTVEHHVEHLL
jgi:hypothetical protein